MNYVDYTVVVVIAISGVFGLYRGFITSAVSLLGWVLAIVLTYQLYPQAEVYLSEHIKSKALVVIVASGGLLIALLIIFGIINSVLYKLIGDLKKSLIDRAVGLLFGLARGFFILSFLFLCFSISLKLLIGKKEELVEQDYPKAIIGATSFKLMENGALALKTFLPESINERFAKLYDGADKKEVDKRFIDNAIDKLTEFTSDEEIKNINIMRQDLSSTESEEMIDIKTLRYLFDNYKKKLKDGSVKSEVFTPKEMQKIESIVNGVSTGSLK
ncbi:CvpA family protein [Candidatus Bandiella euplotis]|uniref:CvpA family protein n=1 Tax=Candidatus Bandiella euplotis TaxID=1664265 RepID=A0ABZ0UJU8_9RICK|nr:CvpA family protein [Candidatus Bandiella woodruffii]WPX96384.1 CvpA family protein [Candidatus Bandiella woodruffii]